MTAAHIFPQDHHIENKLSLNSQCPLHSQGALQTSCPTRMWPNSKSIVKSIVKSLVRDFVFAAKFLTLTPRYQRKYCVII